MHTSPLLSMAPPEPEAEPASTMPPDMLREPAQRPPTSVEQSADLVISTFSGSAPPKNKARVESPEMLTSPSEASSPELTAALSP